MEHSAENGCGVQQSDIDVYRPKEVWEVRKVPERTRCWLITGR